jgi:hypothetical protein
VNQKIVCLCCGKNITEKQRSWEKPSKYCSRACYYALGNRNDKISEKRKALYLEVVELTKAGTTQIEATEQLGVNKNSFGTWLDKQDTEELYKNQVCLYCSAILGEKFHGKRKYCSRLCAERARSHKKNPNRKSKNAYTSEQFKKAEEMYKNGVDIKTISLDLDIPTGTLFSWIHRGRIKKGKP